MQCKSQGLKEVEYDRDMRGHAPSPSSVSLGFADFSHVNVLDLRRRLVNFIVFQGIIKGKGLQALVHFFYQILDKTRTVL